MNIYQQRKVRDPRHLEKVYARRRRRKYGVSQEVYQEMYDNQDGRCLVCHVSHDNLCVDHDHLTNEVRGLLCTNCNSGLGFFKDDPVVLRRAIAYLKGGD